MGVGAERHDLMSQETHAAKWISFRQPVQRIAREADGESFEWTYEANVGEVWEEDEFWIALSWRIDPDGSLGIRKYYESPYRPGERITIEEYYRWIFENSVPGLPEEAQEHNMSPLEYMRAHGAFLVEEGTWQAHMKEAAQKELEDAEIDEQSQAWVKDGKVVAVPPSPQPLSPEGEGLYRLQNPLAPTRVLLEHDGAVGLAGVRAAGVHQISHSSRPHRSREERVRPCPHVPSAHADSHAQCECEMAHGTGQHQPRLDSPGRCGPHRR